MKILFGVCTEGSGHTVQSIAMKQHLGEKHDIVGVLAAKKEKGFSKFFKDEFNIIKR